MKLRSGLFLLLILIAALTVAPQITHAAAITINSLADNTTSGNSLCTLREAINNANGNSDTTGGDCITGSGTDTLGFSVSGTIILGDSLPNITSPITINGTGQTVAISGNDADRVFYIATGGDLSLSNLTVQDGNAGQFFGNRGGAVFNVGGALSATNVTFLSNAANEGGAIYTDYTSTSTTVMNSTFTGNSAVSSGGAVFAFNSTITLTNDTFTGNTANEGGSIYDWGTINIYSSSISNGSADASGGGIFNYGTLTITNSTISGNSAATNGGAIFNAGSGDVTVINSTISGNSAVNGGAIYATFTNMVTVTKSTLSGNTATTEGGAIFVDSTVVRLTSSTLSGNSAPSSGGIHAGTGVGGGTHIAGSIIDTGASGENCTGYILDNGYNVADDASCNFNYYYAELGSRDSVPLNLNALANNEGGTTRTHAPAAGSAAIGVIPIGTTIDNEGVSLACGNLTTDQNGVSRPRDFSIACTSGAVEAAEAVITCPTPTNITSVSQLNNCLIWANVYAGLAELTLGANLTLSTQLPYIIGPTTLNGAGHFIDGGDSVRVLRMGATANVTLNSIIVQNGSTATNGGGISSSGTLTISNSTITSNSASGNGGGIENLGTMTITNSTISNNTLSAQFSNGGGIFNDGVLTLTNSIVTQNSTGTDGRGGGISSSDLSDDAIDGSIIITDSTVSNNSAKTGAGIYVWGVPGQIDGSTISGNDATNGGGLYTYSIVDVLVIDSNFTNNTAVDWGGGFYIDSFDSITTFRRNTFSDNEANFGGGGISFDELNLIDNTFIGNSAGTSGGGFYNYAEVYLATSTFSGNTAKYGAGFYNQGTAEVGRDTLYNNTATDYGGGFFNSGVLNFYNSTVSGNSATYGGGFANGIGTMTATHVTVSHNSAPNGSNIYNYDYDTSDFYYNFLYLAAVVVGNGVNGANCGNLDGDITYNGYNLSDDNSCNFAGSGSANNATLNLGPLQNNGGSTLTRLPGAGSAAINRIPNGTTINNNGMTYTCNQNSQILDEDQRGQARPSTAAGACDVGSVEVAAASGAPEIAVEAPGPTNIGDGSTYNLGTTTVGTPINQTITIRNTGTANLTLSASAPTVTGNFTAGNFGSTTLAPNASTTFSLSCTAATAGAPISGTISFGNNDGDENPFNFTAQCTVNSLIAEIVVEAPGSVNIADGGTHNMGTTTVGTPINQTITVRNIGATNLTISTNPPTVTGSFTAGNFGSTTLAPNASTTFSLSCTAASVASPASGTISFGNNDGDENPFNFTVQCTVNPLLPEIVVEASGAVNIADGGSYDLGVTDFGMPIAQTLTVRNTGSANLTISTNPPTVTGNFSASNFGSTTLAPNASTTFTVRCLAMTAGAPVSGTISFANNDGNENPFNFTITCTVNESPAGAAPGRGYFTTHTPTLTWNRLNGATTYEVQIADNAGFAGATSYPTINGLSFTTPSLPNGIYYWRVRATGAGNWSAGEHLTIAAP